MKETIAETVEYVLRSFDLENKRRLADLLGDALELGPESGDFEALKRAESVLERELSAEEKYRLEMLVRFFHSRLGGYGGNYKGNMSY